MSPQGPLRTTMDRYLTKSLFVKACQCPRKLAYAFSLNHRERETSGFFQNLAENGMKIGIYSRLLFPMGHEIGKASINSIENDKVPSIDDLVQETYDLLNAYDDSTIGTVTLFEAAICSAPYYIRADILHKRGLNHLELMEVKAKSWDSSKGNVEEQMMTKNGKSIRAEFLPYLQDVAFQKMVVQLAFPGTRVEASLILPDKALLNNKMLNLNGMLQVVKNGKTHIKLDETNRQLILDADEILVTVLNVDTMVDKLLEDELVFPGSPKRQSFQDVVAEWGKHVTQNTLMEASTPAPIGSQCSDCEYRTSDSELSGFQQCWQEITGLGPKDQTKLVTDLHYGGKIIEKSINEGKYLMSDLKPNDLGLSDDGLDKKKPNPGLSRKERQWYQVSDTQEVVLDKDFLEEAMIEWRYPYHFVDFETIMPALPFMINKSPYSPLAFQFSHHIMYRDGTVEHASEFLFTQPGECPNRHFLEAFSQCVGESNGTVFRWGAHENTFLSTLLLSESSASYPLVEDLCVGRNRAMVDLMQIMVKGLYVPGSDASSSIKKLLLPTMQHSFKLKEIYSQPSYTGKNFNNMQWWVPASAEEGDKPCDPYGLLSKFDPAGATVTQGGDAITAFEKLQREDTDQCVRTSIESSLRRYCELDTLAMVMMTQGLQDILEDEESK